MLTLPVLCFHPTLPLYLSSGFASHVARGACGRACISASREQHTVTRIQQLSGCRPSFVFFVFGSQPHLYQCARQRDFSSPRDLKLGSCHSDHGSRFSGRCPRPATRAVVSLRLSGRSLHFAVTSREQRTHDKTLHLPHWMRRRVYTAAHGSFTPRARPCACDCAWTAPGTQIP